MHKKNTPKLKFKINTKILFTLFSLSVVLLGISAYIALSNMQNLGKYAVTQQDELRDQTVTDSKEALLSLAEKYVLEVAKHQASLTNNSLRHFERDMNNLVSMVADLAMHILSTSSPPPQTGGTRRRQLMDQPQAVHVVYSQDEEPEDIDNSMVYVTAPDFSGDMQQEIASFGSLNRQFQEIRSHYPAMSAVYIGLESGGFLSLPWKSGYPESFDPRKRPWYRRAVRTENYGWTDTYVDATSGKLVVSCSQPFYTSDNVLLGVVGVDVFIDTFNKETASYLKDSVLVFLVNANGKMIARLGLSAKNTPWDQPYEAENLLESENQELRSIVEDMIRGETGVTKVQVVNRERYLAYVPLINSWSLGAFMSVETITKPAVQIEEQIIAAGEQHTAEFNKRLNRLVKSIIILFVGIIVAVIGISYGLSRKITKPILALRAGADTIGEGNLDYKIAIHTGDELEALADAFNTMTDDLKQYIADLAESTATKERFETELQIGRDIQASLLPEHLVQVPGWEIEAFFKPARQVAGDFYDIFTLGSSGHVFFVIADVCDKGVGPAMFAAIIRTLLRAFSLHYDLSSHEQDSQDSSYELPLDRTNDFLQTQLATTDFFATIFAGVLDPETRVVHYINGGHNPPYIVSAANEIKTPLKPTGPIIGAFPGVKYKINTIRLEAGDTLFTFTDGLPEARDPNGAFFTDKRVQKLLQQPSSSAKEMLDRVVKDVQEYIAEADQFDDITLLVLRCLSEPVNS